MKYITEKTSYGEKITLIPETEDEIREQREYKEWVNQTHCQDPNHEEKYGSYYVPDNQDDTVGKHHWRCKKCRKITQIG